MSKAFGFCVMASVATKCVVHKIRSGIGTEFYAISRDLLRKFNTVATFWKYDTSDK